MRTTVILAAQAFHEKLRPSKTCYEIPKNMKSIRTEFYNLLINLSHRHLPNEYLILTVNLNKRKSMGLTVEWITPEELTQVIPVAELTQGREAMQATDLCRYVLQDVV